MRKLRAARIVSAALLLSVPATSGFGISQHCHAVSTCVHSSISRWSQRNYIELSAVTKKPSNNPSSEQMKGFSLLKRCFGKRQRRLVLSASLFICACWLVKTRAVWAAAKAAVEQGAIVNINNALPAVLGIRNVSLAASLISCTGVAALSLSGFGILARSLLIASTRCILQLYLAGGLFLTYFLSSGQPALVCGWIFGTGILAAWEASTRVEYTYKHLTRHLVLSILVGGGTVLGLTGALQILGPVQPWYSARIWIPVSGMLLGNTVTAAALAASTLTRQMATNQDQVELRLARGATWQEAVNDSVLRNTLSAALTPSINALSVTGIVHIPGYETRLLVVSTVSYEYLPSA
jgi:putative ABC transport system permease protein